MRVDVSMLPALAATFMLVFARIGTMVMLLPGLGEMSMPVRVRLTVARRHAGRRGRPRVGLVGEEDVDVGVLDRSQLHRTIVPAAGDIGWRHPASALS